MGAVQGGCGELRGLTWADVDFEEGQVSVRRTLEESSAGLTFKEPKTARGARTLALPAITVEALREHRKAQPAARVLDVEPVALAQLGQLVEGRCPAVGVAAVAVHHGAAPVAGARPPFEAAIISARPGVPRPASGLSGVRAGAMRRWTPAARATSAPIRQASAVARRRASCRARRLLLAALARRVVDVSGCASLVVPARSGTESPGREEQRHAAHENAGHEQPR